MDSPGAADSAFADSSVTADADASMADAADSQAADGSDATSMDAAPLDADGASTADSASTDGGLDAAADAFDGNCTCTSDACAPFVLAASQASPTSIAIDSTGVYWLDQGSLTTSDGSVMRVDRDGTHLTTFAPSLFAPSDLAVGGGTVYWSVPVPAIVVGQSTSLPSQPQTLASSYAFGIAASATGAAWTTSVANVGHIVLYDLNADAGALLVNDQGVGRIALAGTNVFWASNSGVSTCPLSGCINPVPFWVLANPTIQGIATDATNVYWTDQDTGGVYACPTTGCVPANPAPIYMPPASNPGRIATDGTHVYVATTTHAPVSSALLRMGPDGSGVTVIATGQGLGGIAVGDTCVYWTDDTAGTVYASPK
jgi:hypothetical protein